MELTKKDKEFSIEHRATARDLWLAGQLNSAACHLKREHYNEALAAADEVCKLLLLLLLLLRQKHHSLFHEEPVYERMLIYCTSPLAAENEVGPQLSRR